MRHSKRGADGRWVRRRVLTEDEQAYLRGWAMGARMMELSEHPRNSASGGITIARSIMSNGLQLRPYDAGLADADLAALGLGDTDGAYKDSHCSGCSLCDGPDWDCPEGWRN